MDGMRSNGVCLISSVMGEGFGGSVFEIMVYVLIDVRTYCKRLIWFMNCGLLFDNIIVINWIRSA